MHEPSLDTAIQCGETGSLFPLPDLFYKENKEKEIWLFLEKKKGKKIFLQVKNIKWIDDFVFLTPEHILWLYVYVH